jgi:hypothetical protein
VKVSHAASVVAPSSHPRALSAVLVVTAQQAHSEAARMWRHAIVQHGDSAGALDGGGGDGGAGAPLEPDMRLCLLHQKLQMVGCCSGGDQQQPPSLGESFNRLEIISWHIGSGVHQSRVSLNVLSATPCTVRALVYMNNHKYHTCACAVRAVVQCHQPQCFLLAARQPRRRRAAARA